MLSFLSCLLLLIVSARHANVAKFRAEYDSKNDLMNLKKYNAAFHFTLLHAIIAINVAVVTYLLFTTSTWREELIRGFVTYGITFVFGNFVEYSLHRFEMHSPTSTMDHSSVHHRYFTAN